MYDQAGMVPNDVVLAFWGLILVTLLSTGKGLGLLISKGFDLLNARLDKLIETAKDQHDALKAVGWLNRAEIVDLVHDILVDEKLISPTQEGAKDDSSQTTNRA